MFPAHWSGKANSSHRQQGRAHRPLLEQLEDRCMLSFNEFSLPSSGRTPFRAAQARTPLSNFTLKENQSDEVAPAFVFTFSTNFPITR
jgi:hypothetical protein